MSHHFYIVSYDESKPRDPAAILRSFFQQMEPGWIKSGLVDETLIAIVYWIADEGLSLEDTFYGECAMRTDGMGFFGHIYAKFDDSTTAAKFRLMFPHCRLV